MASGTEETSSDRSALPDTDPFPEALFGGAEALEDPEEEGSFWSRFLPPEVPFIQMALFDQLVHRPYHVVRLVGPFDLRRLARDHANHLFRSETLLSSKGKTSIERLLLALGGGIFGFLDDVSL